PHRDRAGGRTPGRPVRNRHPPAVPATETARASRETPGSRFPSSPTSNPRRRARPRASPRVPASSPSGSRCYPAGCRCPGRSMGKDCSFHLLARAKPPRSASSRHRPCGLVHSSCRLLESPRFSLQPGTRRRFSSHTPDHVILELRTPQSGGNISKGGIRPPRTESWPQSGIESLPCSSASPGLNIRDSALRKQGHGDQPLTTRRDVINVNKELFLYWLPIRAWSAWMQVSGGDCHQPDTVL